MYLNKIKEMTIDKFVVINTKHDNSGYTNKHTSKISRGHTLWESESFRFVMPYELLASLALFLIITVVVKFYLHPNEVNWFKSILELGMLVATVTFSAMHIRNGKREEELSFAVDRWWTYTYLEEETAELKKNIQRKLDIVTGLFINILNGAGVGYVLLPLFKFLFNGANNLGDLLVVDSLHEVPWIYMEIVSGALTISVASSHWGYLVSNMIVISFTHNAQLELAGLAFSTIEKRVFQMMRNWNDKLFHVDDIYEHFIKNEIKTCSRHYQAIYRQTKDMYNITGGLINYGIYMGGCSVTLMGVLIAKESGNNYLMVQVSGMMVALMGLLFLLSYPVDSLMEEVEEFRVQVYGSTWYNFPLSCQKSSHILQTMLMYSPKFKTFLGTEVSLEFLGKLLNVSYYYITTILSMDIK